MPPSQSQFLSDLGARTAHALLATVAFVGIGVTTGHAAVLLNELKIQDSVQSLELKNSGPNRVPLDDLGFRGVGFSIFPLATNDTLEIGEHRVLSIPPSANAQLARIRTRGDCLELFDANLDAVIDRVDCGDSGGAPLDIEADFASTLARTTAIPDPGGTNSADFWTVDFSGTLGAPNATPPPLLGGDVVINEVIPGPDDSVRVELFNRTGAPIDLVGWGLATAICEAHLAGVLPANGYKVFSITPLVLTFNLTIYLFDSSETRIDQMGFSDSPGNETTYGQVLGDGDSFQRVPDGAGPNDGYDLPTIDFGGAVQAHPPTPGGSNGEPQGITEWLATPAPLRLVVRPNPVRSVTEIVLDAGASPQGGMVVADEGIRIVDAMGRIVDVLRPAPGARSVSWAPGLSQPAGTYFAVVRSTNGTTTAKIVVAK